MRTPLILALGLGLTHGAAEAATVEGARLQAAAIKQLRVQAATEGVEASFAPASPSRDVSTSDADVRIEAIPPAHWLRSRIPVLVRVQDSAGRVVVSTVWIAATAPRAGTVYATAGARGQAGNEVRTQQGEVDLARTHGAIPVDSGALGGARLRRAVRAGDPTLASDFEAMPMVLAQQPVRIESGGGAVQLSVAGVALQDGAAGDVIDVRWSGADRPIRARVISHEVVTLEH